MNENSRVVLIPKPVSEMPLVLPQMLGWVLTSLCTNPIQCALVIRNAVVLDWYSESADTQSSCIGIDMGKEKMVLDHL